jgi:hypothetical protein
MIVYHVPINVKWELPTFLVKHESSFSSQATPTIRIHGLFNHKSCSENTCQKDHLAILDKSILTM